ncbi:MAG TPA: hypothetical protein VKU90_09600 [Caulobacteraceae bacterium]|nr:hypothetical protein [Caulobacteraceae bacterium]
MDVVNFVSKRLQRAVAALLCLMALQMALVLASCEPEMVPMAAKVAISR